jgi:glyoxylase-like metal-dependent hydrolase (beta-lactamase superfamily II)
VSIPFVRDMQFEYGRPDVLSPLIRRVVARNPGPFTSHGTGTYIIGRGRVAVVDPGPALSEHVDALLEAVRGETVTHLLVTHTHLDHSPAAAALREATGAPTYAFGPHARRPDAERVEEGADHDFVPDEVVHDGALLRGDGWTVQALHTPGHTSNHVCFALREERALFCGDHVMGWSTSVIAPPDGDMAAYLDSLARLAGRDEAIYYPTHGPPITEPARLVQAFIDHRHERERQIIGCLRDGVTVIPEMVHRMYPGLDRRLHRAAGCSVLAHLVHMVDTGTVRCDGRPAIESVYRLI